MAAVKEKTVEHSWRVLVADLKAAERTAAAAPIPVAQRIQQKEWARVLGGLAMVRDLGRERGRASALAAHALLEPCPTAHARTAPVLMGPDPTAADQTAQDLTAPVPMARVPMALAPTAHAQTAGVRMGPDPMAIDRMEEGLMAIVRMEEGLMD